MNLAHTLIALAVFEGVYFILALFYLPAIAKAIRLSESRWLPRPWTLWLELIPVFNLFWQFRNVSVATSAFTKLVPWDPDDYDFDDEDLEDEDLDYGDDVDLDDDEPEEEFQTERASAEGLPLSQAYMVADESDDLEGDQTRPHAHLWLAAWGRLAGLALLLVSVYAFPRFWAYEGAAILDFWTIPIALFVAAAGFSVWQRARYARQLRRLGKGLSAEDLSLAVVESHDPARCSCTVELATTPDRVEEGVLAWAKDLRWHRVKNAECPLTFRLYGGLHRRLNNGHEGITVEVHVPQEGWKIQVRFVAHWDSWGLFHSAYVPQLSRALMGFVHGVCSEFGQRGVTVAPYELGRPVQDRASLRRLTKARWLLTVALTALGVLCIPGMVASILWREDLFLVPFGALWLCSGLLFVADYLRRRVARIKGRMSLISAGFFLLMGVLFVLLGIFPPTD